LGGATSGIKNKRLVYKLYNENNLNSIVLEKINNLDETDIDEISYTLDLQNIPHGNYVLKV
jgi:hypothetical protein